MFGYGRLLRTPSVFNARRFSHFDLLKRAELEVGYAASFLGLKYIVSEEFSTIASYVRQLVQTKHPLIDTVRTLLAGNRDQNQPSHSLLVLLLCKLASETDRVTIRSNNPGLGSLESGIYQGQRDIAEMAEMMFVGFSIHATIQNLQDKQSHGLQHSSELVRGNKLAVLIGDFILAKVSKGAADTDSSDVVTEISLAVGEASEGNYIRNQLTTAFDTDRSSPSLVDPQFDLYTEQTIERSRNLCSVFPFTRFVKSALLISGTSPQCIERISALSRSLISSVESCREISLHQTNPTAQLLLAPKFINNNTKEDIAVELKRRYNRNAAATFDILTTFPACSTRDIIYDLIESYKF